MSLGAVTKSMESARRSLREPFARTSRFHFLAAAFTLALAFALAFAFGFTFPFVKA